MTISIAGKRVIITGGARGIGAAAVAHFAEHGAHVVSIDIEQDRGKSIANQADAQGPGSVTFIAADVANRADIFAAIDKSVAILGGLDAICAIAGVEGGGSAEDISEAEWDRIVDINAKGTMFTNQAAFPHLRDNGGSIVNFGSDVALSGGVSAPYAASKGAILSLTRDLSRAWGQYRIRVNSLIPMIWTDMYDEYRARLTPEQLAGLDASMLQTIPLGGKLGDPKTDCAPVLEFLVSDASKFISGQIVSVNGGAIPVR